MAKHPHRLILMNKKTWKCTLEGCNFFVHLGLAHVLVGKTGICWGCGEQFNIDEYSLREEMPRCTECRLTQPVEPIEVNIVEEMTPERRKVLKQMGLIK